MRILYRKTKNNIRQEEGAALALYLKKKTMVILDLAALSPYVRVHLRYTAISFFVSKD